VPANLVRTVHRHERQGLGAAGSRDFEVQPDDITPWRIGVLPMYGGTNRRGVKDGCEEIAEDVDQR
jgi:hypothetical protein